MELSTKPEGFGLPNLWQPGESLVNHKVTRATLDGIAPCYKTTGIDMQPNRRVVGFYTTTLIGYNML